METEIIVNVHPREARVGILEDGRLAELHIERGEKVVGNIYKGRVEQVVQGLDAAFVSIGLERNAFLHVDDALDEEPDPHVKGELRHIKDVVKEGQELLVQVTKGPVGTKGARVTTRISLPGKYAVLMAQAKGKVGVSRKIEDEKEREKLRMMGEKVRPREFGLIVRTQAVEVGVRELRRDVRYLQRLWKRIFTTASKTKAPALVHEELSLSHEVLRDVFSENVKTFIIDDKKTFRQVLDVLSAVAPRLKSRVFLYEGEAPLFEKYGIEEEIQKALRRKVWLPHGGYLIIDSTEALTVIDVNTGKFTGTGSLEETILHTNLEAAKEISRQLRLRDIGGIIVIDFIDMERPAHQRRIMTTLREAMKNDRVRTRIMHLTPLGLVEMTRQRTGKALHEIMNVTCPACQGEGKVLSPESVCIRIETAVRAQAKQAKALRVIAHPSVALHFMGQGSEQSVALEKAVGKAIFVTCANRVSPETFRIEQGTARDFRKELAPLKVGKRYQVRPDQIVMAPWEQPVAIVHGYPIALEGAGDDIEEVGCEIEVTDASGHLGRARCVPSDVPARSDTAAETLPHLPDQQDKHTQAPAAESRPRKSGVRRRRRAKSRKIENTSPIT